MLSLNWWVLQVSNLLQNKNYFLKCSATTNTHTVVNNRQTHHHINIVQRKNKHFAVQSELNKMLTFKRGYTRSQSNHARNLCPIRLKWVYDFIVDRTGTGYTIENCTQLHFERSLRSVVLLSHPLNDVLVYSKRVICENL